MARAKEQGRGAMAARLAAVPFALLLASLASACLARFLPASRVEAATAGMLISFLLCALIVMWAFAARSILRFWLWAGGASCLLGGALFVSIATGGRA